MRSTMTWILRASFALALFSPIAAAAQTAPITRPGLRGGPAVMPAASVTTPAPCDAKSMDSPPAKAWLAAQGWRYPDAASAAAAYLAILGTGQGGSPWPNWFVPVPDPKVQGVLVAPPVTTLPVGTRFQMAMAPVPSQPGQPGQTDKQPGGLGTFNYIASVQDVRQFLAVTHQFKPQVDRVVTYEVTQLLPVLIGPIGPQVDAETCEYLPGGWSQFYLLPKWDERINYLKIVEVRPIG